MNVRPHEDYECGSVLLEMQKDVHERAAISDVWIGWVDGDREKAIHRVLHGEWRSVDDLDVLREFEKRVQHFAQKLRDQREAAEKTEKAKKAARKRRMEEAAQNAAESKRAVDAAVAKFNALKSDVFKL